MDFRKFRHKQTVAACLLAVVTWFAPASAWAGFGEPLVVTTDRFAGGASVAIDPEGRALFAWTCLVPTLHSNSALRTRFRSADGSWVAFHSLSQPYEKVLDKKVAMDSHGNALIVWMVWHGAIRVIQARVRSAAGIFGRLQTISDPAHSAFRFQVAFDGAGRALIVWQEEGGIFARSRSPGGALGARQTLSTHTTGTGPQLAVSPAGRALVVWAHNTSVLPNVLHVVEGVARSSSTERFDRHLITFFSNLRSPPLNHFRTPQVAMDAKGNAFVVSGDRNGSYARVRSATGVLGPVLTLAAYSGRLLGEVRREVVAVGPNGKALFVWEDTAHGRMQARFGSIAGALGPISLLDRTSGSNSQAALTASGAGLVVWQNNDTHVIKAVVASSAGVFGKAQTITEQVPDQSTFLGQLAVNARGDALITWDRRIYSGTKLQETRIEAVAGTVP